MSAEFRQIEWDARLEADCRELVRLAIREDLDRAHDWTTLSLVPEETLGQAAVVARRGGVIAGLPAARMVVQEMDERLQWHEDLADGTAVVAGQRVAQLHGPARSLLTAERTLLNFLGRLSGVATLTRAFVEQVTGTKARIYDTRKTTPGWRRLEKYAVRAGGGWNHRLGLFDAVLIKDNHLALGASAGDVRYTPAQAVARARQLMDQANADRFTSPLIIEIEVDTLEQLDQVLPAGPDIVLLDNMRPEQLRQAVARRDAQAPGVKLEASGGIDLSTVAEVARTGIDRISVGALTHSAVSFDLGLDWGQ
jgi:nicotinate-nucleotide pyrophosphorylase (carboxylating)